MNTRKYSSNQEKRISKNLGGKRQPNSGATPWYKGDNVVEKFLIEAKTQIEEKKSFTIKKEWIEKNKEEAFAMGKPFSAVAFNFGGLSNKKDFYIIDEGLMKALVEHLIKENL